MRPARSWRWAVAALTAAALALRWPVPEPAWTHFDELAFVVLPLGFWGGDLDPHYFNYPTFHFYLCSALYAAAWLASGAQVREFVAWHYLVDGQGLIALARGLSTVLSAATVLATGLLARRLYGDRAGLLAAGFLAVLPLSVRFAHLAATDTPAVFWVVVALLWAVRARQQGGRAALVAAGVCTGLAAATKYPAALVALPVAVALAARRPAVEARGAWLAAAAALAAFGLATPYVWLDAPTFAAHLTDMARSHLASTAAPASPSGPVVALRHGIGTAGSLAAVGALVHGARRRAWPDLAVASGALVFGGFVAASGSTFLRYALPLAPFAALLMARAVDAVGPGRALAAAAVVALGAEPLYASVCTRALLSGPDTRARAQAWVAQVAPRGGRLDEPDSPCGRIRVLRPGEVLVRQAHYLRSYGPASLRAAYESLAARPDLPPLYLDLGGQAPAPGPRLSLRYRHPVCPPVADTLTAATRQTFRPGRPEAAAYDGQDWLFVPVAGFGQVEATGPTIDAAPAGGAGEPASASSFFAGMARVLAAYAAHGAGDEARAAALLDSALAAWPAPEAWVGEETASRLLLDSAGLRLRAGRAAQAIDPLQRAVALRPSEPTARLQLGRAWAAAGHLDRAIAEWTTLVERHPGYTPAYRDLAQSLRRLGDPARAEEYERQAEAHSQMRAN